MARAKKKSLVRRTAATTFEELITKELTEQRVIERPETLSAKRINVAPAVFQWRLQNENLLADENHVRELASVLELQPLDPILVTAIGKHFFVVDGHHRFDAYETFRWKEPIPVEYFEGSVAEAQTEALERNKKNRLALSRSSRYEAAWKLLKRGVQEPFHRLSWARIGEMTQVSRGTIANMSRALKQHGNNVFQCTWSQARRLDWPKEYPSTQGPNLVKDVDITARRLRWSAVNCPLGSVGDGLQPVSKIGSSSLSPSTQMTPNCWNSL